MEKLKGFRTQIAAIIGAILASIDGLREIVVSLGGIADQALGDGGAGAVIVAAVVSLKAVFADIIPKLKGELNK